MRSNGTTFITRHGRHIPEAATDQAGSDMWVRTVSRYTDGAPIDRPQVCVSLDFAHGDLARARHMAEDLDRHGYLPPKSPMTQAELDQLLASDPRVSDIQRRLIWEVCARGVPLGMALERAGVPHAKRRNLRRLVMRVINAAGWGQADGD